MQESPVTLETIRRSARPIYGPTVIPPLPWSSPGRGGYHETASNTGFNVTLMRTKDASQRHALGTMHAQAMDAEKAARSQERLDRWLLLEARTALRDSDSDAFSGDEAALEDGHVRLQSAADAGAGPTAAHPLGRIFSALDCLGSQRWRIHSGVLSVRPALSPRNSPARRPRTPPTNPQCPGGRGRLEHAARPRGHPHHADDPHG